MPSTSISELQQKLFKQIGVDAPDGPQGRKQRNGRGSGPALTRKDQRKAQRVQKKSQKFTRQAPPSQQSSSKPRQTAHSSSQPGPRSILKKQASTKKSTPSANPASDQGDEEKFDLPWSDDDSDPLEGLEDEEDDDESDGDVSDEEVHPATKDEPKSASQGARVPQYIRDKLAQDDAEIDEFEKKLGIKKGRKSMPQAFKDEGLADLLGEFGAGDDDERIDDEEKKRKRDYDDWLSSKRRKTAKGPELDMSGHHGHDGFSDDDEGSVGFDDEEESGMDLDDDEFDGFDSDGEQNAPEPPRKRENPYVAPTTGAVVAKYVPPSLRKGAGSEEETKSRLRKQVQGLINRLTDANILSIVQSAEELYQSNARGDVTEVITDAIIAQICKPESLPDQFFVLTGGFAAAIYKVTGSSFGSHLIRRVAKDFGDEYDKATKDQASDDYSAIRKEPSNLIAFLAQLYAFEVVTCKIMFDYMERLLSDITELNVELLLRICRMTGRLLRKDDPQSLKHVSSVLNKAVSKVGYGNIAARTKFMVETISDLKNSKPKAKGMESGIVSEHVQRMKKRLGELKSQSRRLDGLAPMGMSLDDIEGAETRGKWWLVGASVPPKESASHAHRQAVESGTTATNASDDEDMDIVLPDYPSKARAQGFSTTTQVAIFTAILSAMNYEHGYRQFLNLKLKRDDQLEISRVLVQCVGSEVQYNPYYALVAKQACSNPKIRFAFQDRLWKMFRGLGESLFGEDAEDEETADSERMKDEARVGNVARFYASLVADGSLTVAVLKPLDLPQLSPWTTMFVEWLIIGLLQECKGKGAEEDSRVGKVFGPARDLPTLAAGLHWFLRKRVRKSKVVGAKELKKLERVREKAQLLVHALEQEG